MLVTLEGVTIPIDAEAQQIDMLSEWIKQPIRYTVQDIASEEGNSNSRLGRRGRGLGKGRGSRGEARGG